MALRNKTSRPIEVRLTRVSTEQFATIFEPTTDECDIDTNIDVAVMYDTHSFAIRIKLSFLHNESVFMRIEVAYYFEISPECWAELSNGGTADVVVPKDFMKHLVFISLNTTRGVLHSKTENTPFNQFTIPLIDQNEISGGDLIMAFY